MNGKLGGGGGGAIDLATHLMDCDFKTALRWLDANFAAVPFLEKQRLNAKAFRPPPRCDAGPPSIEEYLCSRHRIPVQTVNALLRSGRLYADRRYNVAFPMLGKNAEIVGAELHATGVAKWRGMVPGSRKNLGRSCVAGKLPLQRIRSVFRLRFGRNRRTLRPNDDPAPSFS